MVEGLKDTITISLKTKNDQFFLADENKTFIYITPEGQMNKYCLLADDITNKAREYADKHCPKLTLPDSGIMGIKTDKQKFIDMKLVDCWSYLFHLALWNILEINNNKVTYMKQP